MSQEEIIKLITSNGWEFDILHRLVNRIYEKQKNLVDENGLYRNSLNVIHSLTTSQDDKTIKVVHNLSEIC